MGDCEGRFVYKYPRPMVTVDAVVFARGETGREVLLIQRRNEPFAGEWALPGGFVDMDESLEAAVVRELAEETGLTGIPLTQFHAFGDPGRDPRGRNICVAFWGVINRAFVTAQADDDALDARWFPVNALPPLAFDHEQIIQYALSCVYGEIRS